MQGKTCKARRARQDVQGKTWSPYSPVYPAFTGSLLPSSWRK